MEDDDLEYDITFPSPIAGVESMTERDEYAKSEPVVILLGWLGCKEKHLSKYGQIYDQKGCITIRYTAPKDVAYFNFWKMKEIACKVLDLLDDYSIMENPVFFHVFSNNGSYVYNSIVKVLTSGEFRKYQKIQVKGTVFDSAPGKRRLLQGVRAFTSNMHDVGIFYRYLTMISLIFFLLYSGIRASLLVLYDHRNKENNEHYLYDNMANDKSRWPQLYLYSMIDKLVLYKDVEEMVQRRQALGVHVDSVSWDNTDHVSHFREDPNSYTTACWDFLDFCLGEQREGLEQESDDDLNGKEEFQTSLK